MTRYDNRRPENLAAFRCTTKVQPSISVRSRRRRAAGYVVPASRGPHLVAGEIVHCHHIEFSTHRHSGIAADLSVAGLSRRSASKQAFSEQRRPSTA